ncbi:hypothetical protein H4S07_000221 [Coemansia furcata]|uniref:Uncharacterized protein n=1 Tax=Coemansia furcata TaxID=417177 RepID=A0ACC1LSU0_9FUNG|nr:hypothetical protein H4S07_000221 [Coemansia furcata]
MTSIPLSLRRKVVIALDADHVTSDNNEGEGRFLCFKTVAWCKANLLRPQQDHVFLITSLDDAMGAFDGGVLSAMWTSLNSPDEDPHASRAKAAEASLRRLASALHATGVSCTIDVLRGPPAQTVSDSVRVRRAVPRCW